MSRTKYVEYSGNGFWAYDVALDVFLKHLIDSAEALEKADAPSWLEEAKQRWRNAAVPDCGLDFDRAWMPEGLEVVIGLIRRACETLALRESIPAAEVESWMIIDDLEVSCRGDDPIPTKPIIMLGQAISALIDGTLPSAPPDTAWFYVLDTTPRLIGMRKKL